MTLRTPVLLCLIWLCLAGCLLPAARLAADPVGSYLQARQAAKPLLGAGEASDILRHPGAYAGKTLEMAVAVAGLVTAGDDQTLLLSIGGDSVSAPLPARFRAASWLEAGAQIRALFLVAPEDSTLPNGLRLIAAAPEGDVVAAEAQEAAREAARTAALARSLPMVSGSVPSRPVGTSAAGAGHPAGALSQRALAIYGPYHSLVRRWNRRLSEAEVDKITTSILFFSDQNNIDPRLVVATIIAESDFDVHSTSRAGAMGLAQIMPDEAQSLGVTNPYDPIQNIGAAVHLLRGHLDKYGGAPADGGVIPLGQIALTMAAYNAGPGAVRKYHGVPPYRETQRYIARITKLYRQMCGLTQQATR